MTQPVNLNKARKQKARAQSRARADANAAKHGRTKAQRALQTARSDKARKMLDQHRIGGEDQDEK